MVEREPCPEARQACAPELHWQPNHRHFLLFSLRSVVELAVLALEAHKCFLGHRFESMHHFTKKSPWLGTYVQQKAVYVTSPPIPTGMLCAAEAWHHFALSTIWQLQHVSLRFT